MWAKYMGQIMNESNVFTMWYESIDDAERADVSVLENVISVFDGYTNNVTYLLINIFNY